MVLNASGREPMLLAIFDGVKTLITKPHVFLKQPSFLMCWGVYAGIYTAANNVDVICERNSYDPFYPKFFLTSFVSVNLMVAKDQAFGKLFGAGEPKPMKISSMACFGTRNGMTILAGFSLPPHVSAIIQQNTNLSKAKADSFTQLVIPVTMQIFNTPLHLLGYDIYNRESATASERVSFIKREYTKTLIARIGHIFPAYGIGGVLNQYIRKQGKNILESPGSFNPVVLTE